MQEAAAEDVALVASRWLRPLLLILDNFAFTILNQDDPLPLDLNSTGQVALDEFLRGVPMTQPKASYAWANALLYIALKDEQPVKARWVKRRIFMSFDAREREAYVMWSVLRMAAEEPSHKVWRDLGETEWRPSDEEKDWQWLTIAAAREGNLEVLDFGYSLTECPMVVALRERRWLAVDLLRRADKSFFQFVFEEKYRVLPLESFGLEESHIYEYGIYDQIEPERATPIGRLTGGGRVVANGGGMELGFVFRMAAAIL